MNLLILMKLSDKKCRDKLKPLSMVDEIGRILVLRHSRGPTVNKVEYITPPRFFLYNSVFLNIWKFFFGISLIRKEKIDLIISFYFFPHNIIATGLGLIFNRPTMASLIGTDMNTWFENRIFNQAFLPVLRRNSLIFVTGKRSRHKFLLKGVPYQQLKILPNSIDVAKLICKKKERTTDLIFIGSLISVKRVDIIIDMLESISKRMKEISLIIVGSGSQDERLRKKVKNFNLKSNIKFIGYTSNVSYWLCRSKVLLLASESEGRPTVIMEAMICGTVPVVLDVGDIRDICSSGKDSILVEDSINFKSQYVEQLISLFENDEYWNFLSKNAQKRREDFSYSATASVWRNVIKRFIQRS